MLPLRVRIAAAAPLLALLAPGTVAAQPAAPEWTVPAAPPPAPISREEYAARRSKLVEKMGPGVLLVLGADEPDTDYMPFAQNCNRALRTRVAPVVARYRDIGVRIEDDYFITPAGVERVSEGAPREIAEIEALMAQPSDWNRGRRPEVVEWYRGTSPR